MATMPVLRSIYQNHQHEKDERQEAEEKKKGPHNEVWAASLGLAAIKSLASGRRVKEQKKEAETRTAVVSGWLKK